MKISEFLLLSDDDKVAELEKADGEYCKVTEDVGKCSQCGKETDAGAFCFGCHKLICCDCFDQEPQLSECLNRPIHRSEAEL